MHTYSRKCILYIISYVLISPHNLFLCLIISFCVLIISFCVRVRVCGTHAQPEAYFGPTIPLRVRACACLRACVGTCVHARARIHALYLKPILAS